MGRLGGLLAVVVGFVVVVMLLLLMAFLARLVKHRKRG